MEYEIVSNIISTDTITLNLGGLQFQVEKDVRACRTPEALERWKIIRALAMIAENSNQSQILVRELLKEIETGLGIEVAGGGHAELEKLLERVRDFRTRWFPEPPTPSTSGGIVA